MVCASRAARHLASRQGPNWAGSALVLAGTRERSKTVVRDKLVANSAIHDACPADSRVCTFGRAQPFVLGESADKTQQHSQRDTNGELPTHICRSVAVEVACPSGRCYYTRLRLVVLCTGGSAFFLTSEIVAITVARGRDLRPDWATQAQVGTPPAARRW